MANQLGKRYICGNCNTEILCTKTGTGEVQCCGVLMTLQVPKPLPSSD